MANRHTQWSRRKFLTEGGKGLCVIGIAGLGMTQLQAPTAHAAPQGLRPPGALEGDDFLAACIRCGLCVEACPYDMLHLAKWTEPVPTGTPYFLAREKPCEMCDDIPCLKACPTGALNPELENIDDARMGTAVLIDHENCLNWQGLRCDVCYRVCPVIDKAITLELHHNARTNAHAVFIPTVNADYCTGCGKCEQACVLEETAIKVLPTELAQGELGHHYRWGWEEKEKAGQSLLGKDELLDLPDRMPLGEKL